MINHRHEPADGLTVHYIGPELETRRRDDVNQMKMIRSYRGVRHERGQKVRGQRTRSNGRTGMAAGVLKKTAKEQAAAAGKEAAPAAAPAAPKAAEATKPATKKE
jgi:small subunit ribosomal protein S13